MDWVVRLKHLLHDFAVSAHTLACLPQKDSGTQLDFASMPVAQPPITSPYGDDWDLLWLGHCGADLVQGIDLVVRRNDASVPQHRHLQGFGDMAPLTAFPEHTHAIARRLENPVCSTAYAVSHRGARALLHAMGVKVLDAPFDVMLRSWCDDSGIYAGSSVPHVCIGVVPALFKHWRSRGPLSADSDISSTPEGYREQAMSPEIRWSVRRNPERIWKGGVEFDDQYPDE